MIAICRLEKKQGIGVGRVLQRQAIGQRGEQVNDIGDVQLAECLRVGVLEAGGSQVYTQRSRSDCATLFQLGNGLEERLGIAFIRIERAGVKKTNAALRIV